MMKQNHEVSKVPEGYKQTEVGIIPDDWKLRNYGDLFLFLSTSTNSRADLSDNGDYGYIHYGDIHTRWENKLDLNDDILPRISRELVNSSFLQEGDLVVADASEDYEGIAKSIEIYNIGTKKVVAGLHTYLLRDNSKVFQNGFRGFIHENKYVKDQIDKLATGLKVYGISKANLSKVLIPIPPLKEQTAIANALSDVDALIAELERLIAKKEAIKTGAMQQLLTGRTRLPQFAKREDGTPKGYKTSELGEIPEDWELYRLPEKIWYQEGPGLRNWQFTATGIKVINVTNLQENGYLDLDRTDRHISWEEFDRFYKHFKCDAGDFVIASSGNSYCKSSLVRECDLPLVMNTSVIRFKPLDGFCKGFMEVFLKSDLFKSQIDLLITGGAQPNFGPYHLDRIFLPAPINELERTSIAEILSDMYSEIEALEKRLDKTKALKQGMMQELLTGRTRLV